MLKKVILATSLAAAASSVFAAQTSYCPLLNGAWSGTYTSANGSQQPVSLYLNYQSNGYVYGYTLPANDQNGNKFGFARNGASQSPIAGKYLMWAKCTYHPNQIDPIKHQQGVTKLSQFHFVSNPSRPITQCGGLNTQVQLVHLAKPVNLVLNLPFNNNVVAATFTSQTSQGTANLDQAYINQINTLQANPAMNACQPQ